MCPIGDIPIVQNYDAEVLETHDYYPFGMGMPGREYLAGDAYGYEFNGKETDEETFDGASDFGLREYDERLGRFFNKDPFGCYIANKSTYCFAGNSPITFIDQNGGFMITPETGGTAQQRAKLAMALRAISKLANKDRSLNNPFIREFMLHAGLSLDNDGLAKALSVLSYNSGPIVVINSDKERLASWRARGDNNEDLSSFVFISSDLLNKNAPSDYPGEIWGLSSRLTILFSIWHEGIHYSEYNFSPVVNGDCYLPPIPTGAPCTPNGCDNGDWAEVHYLGFDLMHPYNWEQWWNNTYSCVQQSGGLFELQNFQSAHDWYVDLIRQGKQPRASSINPANFVNAGNKIGTFARELGKDISKLGKRVADFVKGLFGNRYNLQRRR